MFNVVEKNQKLVKGIMIAVTATFVLWGIGGYLGMSNDNTYVAKVGSKKIYPQDIDRAIQQNPQNTDKMQILFGLINRQLLLNNIEHYHLVATKDQLQNEIANIPAFQDKGKFSLNKYEAFLNNNFMSATQFQKNVEQQLLLNQILDFFKSADFSSNLFNQKFTTLLSRQRNVSMYIIDPHQFYGQVNVSESQVSDYYTQNIAKFTLPERVKVQYLELDLDDVARNVQVADSEIDKYILEHQAQVSGQQVDASHILFVIPVNADLKTRAEIKARARKVLAQVKANPKQFAELATKYSQDSDSAKNGGELGFFAKGTMAKPFEDAVFKLKPGQISDLVETEYGYHIIKLNQIKGNDPKVIRSTALSQLQKQKAVGILQKELEQLSDITYNQPSSLEPAAKKLGLTIQTSDWINKGEINGNFANPKVQKMIFNSDVIKDHNNSEVVDLDDGTHTVYRVLDYTPSKVESLAIVESTIMDQLKLQQATGMAYQEGQKEIAQLEQGSLQLKFESTQDVNLLAQSPDISSMAVKQIFGVPFAKLPAYTGSIDAQNNFVIYRINHESINQKFNQQGQDVIQQMDTSNAMLDLGAYVGALRSQYSISYRVDRLNLQSQ